MFFSSSRVSIMYEGRLCGGQNTNNLNASTHRYAGLYKTKTTTNITGVGWKTADVTGTPTIQVDLYAVDSNLLPTGSSLASGTVTATAQTDQTITFGTPYTPTSGTIYAFVFKNASADPTTAYFKLSANQTIAHTWDQMWAFSTNGTDYSTWIPSFICYPTLASGTDAPFMTGSLANDGGLGPGLYDINASRNALAALKVNLPSAMKLCATYATISKTGSPNYAIVCDVLNSSGTSIAVSAPVLLNNMTGSTAFLFTSEVSLSASTDYYIAFRASAVGSGDSSNYYRVNKTDLYAGCKLPSWIVGSYFSTAWGTPSWSAYSPTLAVSLVGYPATSSGGGGSLVGPSGLVG